MTPDPHRTSQPDPQVIAALSGADSSRDRALALRTRRAVFTALHRRHTDRAQERRSLLLALLLTLALAFALAPAIWAGFDELTGGGALFDLPGMLLALGVTLSLAMAAVLFLLLGDRHRPAQARSGRR